MTSLRLVHLFATLLGTYGDRGNVAVLVRRARARGIEVEVVSVDAGGRVPSDASLYFAGGGEDRAQTTAVELLRQDGGLRSGVMDGGVVFAVCAGMQVLGNAFSSVSGTVAGLGLLDVLTVMGQTRAVGGIVGDAGPLGLLTGFENHAGHTILDSRPRPLGDVLTAVGNGDGTDGVVQGRIIGTYLHWPVLARNPRLADHLLELSMGRPLDPVDDPQADVRHLERLRAAGNRCAHKRRPR
jgi:lipid II isoglutaminyl synthase (glutamine-hydrolysing)